MCFTVCGPAVKAEKDIECWKVMSCYLLNDKVNSCCFPVKTGYSMGEEILGTGELHSHPRRHAKALNKFPTLTSQVVHSVMNYDSAKKILFWYSFFGHNSFCLVRCIIPKGTWYWYNPNNHEYVSFKLRLIKIEKRL